MQSKVMQVNALQSNEAILAELQQIMQQLFEIDADDITPDTHLYDDLDLDSIDAIDMVVKVQELTGKKIKPEDFKSVRYVRDVVSTIHALLNDTAP
jgi:acyl carrier protein